MYWDLSAAASRERGESWGGEGDSVGCVYGEERETVWDVYMGRREMGEGGECVVINVGQLAL